MTTRKYNKVLVTGGSGFIGLHIIHQLLEKGYEVHTTTRSLSSDRAKPLHILKEKHANLHLFEADLLKSESFLEPMQGVDAVVQVATPIISRPKDAYQDMLKPALEGTKNVLETCLKVESVKVIVVTSSMAAVSSGSPDPNKTYTDKDFVETTLEESPYSFSKLQAEKYVWEFHKEHKDKYRVVTICPTFVVGPYLNEVAPKFSIDDTYKSNIGLNLVKAWLKDDGCNFVDVRDVAKAHVNAIEIEEAAGRFLMVAQPGTWDTFKQYIANYSKKSVQDLMPEEMVRGGQVIAKVDTTSTQNVLKINFIGLEDSVRDMFAQFQEFN